MANIILEMQKEEMDEAIAHFEDSLKSVRTGMANANMLDHVLVDYYGSPTPVKQLAGISVQEGRTIVIKPYDSSSLKDIEKACNKADLGITPQNDGTVIRLTVPQLTGDTRKEMCKKVGKMAEEAKVRIRNIRRDANDDIKKCDGSEDEIKDGQNRVQKLTDKFVKEIDEIGKAKEKDIMTV